MKLFPFSQESMNTFCYKASCTKSPNRKREHETVPLQPSERKHLLSQGELHEKPQQNEGREGNETVSLQPREREHPLSQGKLHEKSQRGASAK